MEVVRLLLEPNAGKEKADDDGRTPLFIASQIGHVEVARLLLEANADKDTAAKNGLTQLFTSSLERPRGRRSPAT